MAAPLKTNPLRIKGPWAQGYALDIHSSSSKYLGDNEFGHPVYETLRTPLGEALYQLKYCGNRSVIPAIALTVRDFLGAKNWQVDAIVPVPPSNPQRPVQAVREIAGALGGLAGLPVCDACVTKQMTTEQMKNVFDRADRERLLAGVFQADLSMTQGKRLLLIDDLYRSGATAAAVTQELLNGGKAGVVYFIAVTRTRRNG